MIAVRRRTQQISALRDLEDELFEALLDAQVPDLRWRGEDCEQGFAAVAQKPHIIVLMDALHQSYLFWVDWK